MSRINHVSVNATDLQASVEFYARLIGAEPVATPDFPGAVQWMAVGDTQLHIFASDVRAPGRHHFGVEVGLDRLVAAYRMAAELGVFDDESFGHRLVGLPGDLVQLYLRDPSGNLVELDAVGTGGLPEDLRAELRVLDEDRPQRGAHADARLFVGEDRPAPRSSV